MARPSQLRAEHVVAQVGPFRGVRFNQAPPCLAILTELGTRGLQRPLQDHSGPVIQGMGQGSLRLNPLQAMFPQRIPLEAR